MKKKAVSYCRVSYSYRKDLVSESYSIDAQQTEVEEFAKENGYELVGKYREIAKSSNFERTKLIKTLDTARINDCPIIVSRIDRVTRSVSHFSKLIEEGYQFITCACPSATQEVLYHLVVTAEHESKRASERTKSAMKAAKKRGVKFGSARPGHWDGIEHKREKGRKKATEANIVNSKVRYREYYQKYVPKLREMRIDKGFSLRKIAKIMNEEGIPVLKGKAWSHAVVSRILAVFEI